MIGFMCNSSFSCLVFVKSAYSLNFNFSHKVSFCPVRREESFSFSNGIAYEEVYPI